MDEDIASGYGSSVTSAVGVAPWLHIALVHPEIPNNTGNIGRLCVGLGARLHLVEPLGFEIDEHAVRRSGLDYWPRVDLRVHADLSAYEQERGPARWFALSARGGLPMHEVEFRAGDHLVFGRESSGLPTEVVERASTDDGSGGCVVIPLRAGERSLNLANAACVVAYEALRQMVARGEVPLDTAGRIAAQ